PPPSVCARPRSSGGLTGRCPPDDPAPAPPRPRGSPRRAPGPVEHQRRQPRRQGTAAAGRRVDPFPDRSRPDLRDRACPAPFLGRQLRDSRPRGEPVTTTADHLDIDVRSSLERFLASTVATDGFSEAEMNMIDVAAVHVYKKARAALPSDLVYFERDGDPAGVIRSWAYQWANEHTEEGHARTGGRIVKHVRRRHRQELKRYLRHRLRTLPTGLDPEVGKAGLEVIAEEKGEKKRDIFTTTRPVKR